MESFVAFDERSIDTGIEELVQLKFTAKNDLKLMQVRIQELEDEKKRITHLIEWNKSKGESKEVIELRKKIADLRFSIDEEGNKKAKEKAGLINEIEILKQERKLIHKPLVPSEMDEKLEETKEMLNIAKGMLSEAKSVKDNLVRETAVLEESLCKLTGQLSQNQGFFETCSTEKKAVLDAIEEIMEENQLLTVELAQLNNGAFKDNKCSLYDEVDAERHEVKSELAEYKQTYRALKQQRAKLNEQINDMQATYRIRNDKLDREIADFKRNLSSIFSNLREDLNAFIDSEESRPKAPELAIISSFDTSQLDWVEMRARDDKERIAKLNNNLHMLKYLNSVEIDDLKAELHRINLRLKQEKLINELKALVPPKSEGTE